MKSKFFAFLALAFFWMLTTPFSTSWAQDIDVTVAPNVDGSTNYVDIENTTSGRWYFFTNPTPAAATMSRISGLSEFVWPSVGNFAPDPTDFEQDRIFQGEYLRVYPNSLGVGTVIQIVYSATPEGTQYDFNVTVTAGAQVTSLNIIDPSPTSAATVQWGVSFDQAISGVTAANFVFNNPDSISGMAITSVTADSAEPSTNWTVTASTGTGTGLLGLNWAGHQTEIPSVPNAFVGQYYDFSPYPVISQYPSNAGINVGSTVAMSVAASVRGGETVNYQWYSGTSVNPTAATAISGATNSSYTPPTFSIVGSFQFFCRVFTTVAYYTDSTTAVITVVVPPQIITQPQSAYAAPGQTATFSVAAVGSSLNYQWYSGVAPDTSNPVGGDSASYTTPALSANTNCWVQVSNPGPTIKDSATATADIVTSLTPSAAGYAGVATLPYPAAFAVTAWDIASNLATNLPVTFTAPGGAGAGGSFPGTAVAVTVKTDSNGVATAPVFTANGVMGSFNVTANFSTLAVNLPATNNVLITNAVATTNSDAGPGSLRNCLALYPVGSIVTITFAPSLSGATILLTTGALPLNDNFTIDASALPGGITINGNHASGVFVAGSGTTNVLTALSIANGVADFGGGIDNIQATLSLNQCTLSGNSATNNGGAIDNDAGAVTVANCTFSGNQAGGAGGALDNYLGPMTVNQSTIAGNTGGYGGGIYNWPSSTLNVIQSTVSGNSSGSGGGINNNGTAGLTNSIVAGNEDVNLIGSYAGADNLTNGDPMLAPLGNYGGSTPTLPPLPGSPALAAGGSTPFTTDQRGFPRAAGQATDLGAVELQTPTMVVTTNADSGAGSLRQAISQVDVSSTITFASNLSGATILLTSGELQLNDDLVIDASALPGGITIDGNQNGSVFEVAGGTINALTALTIANGSAGGYYGGGVINFGTVTVNRCTLTENTAYLGGGLFNFSGTVTANQCTVEGNSASDSGGGLFNYTGTMNVNQCTVTSNSASASYFSGGGGVNN